MKEKERLSQHWRANSVLIMVLSWGAGDLSLSLCSASFGRQLAPEISHAWANALSSQLLGI